ncbi:hypothetical protein JZ751_001604 [Albula glossodonta]|uniref:Gypsy retrotransposon integrase-like protein 1 n=1 Tax=Albula glossodonta TaxID=121402 RepID=A0A8T2PUA0_9TELE|nr:hypothetical protein JZ751_001604 [Albula glossodonta]
MLSMDSLQVAEEEVVESTSNRLEDIFTFLDEGSYPPSMNPIRKKNLKRYAQKFVIEEGRLYYVGPKKEEKREVVIGAERKRQIFLECHFNDIGHHLGQKKTVHRIQTKYYWLGIVKDVVDWVTKHLCDRWNVVQKVSPVEQPQLNALYDRSSSLLREAIRQVVTEKQAEWDDFLDPVLFVFRTSANPTTRFTPYYLMFNREASLPSEVDADLLKYHQVQEVCPAKEESVSNFVEAMQEQQNTVKQLFPPDRRNNDKQRLRVQRMRTAAAVGCNLFFILVDIVVSTILYVRGSHSAVFVEDLQDFDVFRSVFDLWGTLLVRVSLLLGASIGVSWNNADGPQRVSMLETLSDLLCLVVTAYALAKLLLFSEQGSLMYDPWFLSLFSWTVGSAIGTMCLWRLLAKSPNVVAGVGEGCEESDGLINQVVEEEEEIPGEKEEPHSGATVGRLLSYCKKDALLLGIAFLFLLLSAVCEAFIPYYTGQAIDGIVIHKSMEYFVKPMATLTVLALVSSIAIGVRGGVFSITFARLNVRLRNLLFRSLMRQEIGFFDANHTGDITSRLTSDTTQVSDLISENVNLFLRSLIKALGFCFFMFSMSWKLTLVTIMGFPFIAVISKLYGEYYKRLTKAVQNALAQANKLAEETISAMRTVRSFANEEQEADSYYARLNDMFQLNKKQALAYSCYMWSSCISELALQVGILFYGGHLVSIASVYTGLMQGVGAAEKVFEYIDRKPKLPQDGQEAPETLKGLVEFRNVSFAYPTRPDTLILKNVSFTVRPGEVTALVGPSGSGKSSCVCLLENFYTPQQGQVLLDGQPVHTYQHSYLHSQVALVGQEPVLFARSVMKNISYGLLDTPMEAVVQAAVKANAHDFITSFSKGYETGVGEKGTQLSGGQKQRVAIARALIRKPHVLILDEATSALDAESEHIVQQALNDIMRDHTVLVIAHRLSTVERANNIIVIDRGSVVEQGPHRELMARGGLYCKLVQRQVLGIETGAEPLKSPEESAWQLREKQQGCRRGSSESESTLRY